MCLGLNAANFEKDNALCVCLIHTAGSIGKCLV